MELRFLPSTVTGPLLLLPFWRAISARFCFCSSVRVLAGDFGAFLFLFLGEAFLHDGCSVIKNWGSRAGEDPDFTVGDGEGQPDRGRGGGSWK